MLSQSLLFENYFNLAPPLPWQEGNCQIRRNVPQAFLILPISGGSQADVLELKEGGSCVLLMLLSKIS